MLFFSKSQNTKHSIILDSMKKADSVPVETRTDLSKTPKDLLLTSLTEVNVCQMQSSSCKGKTVAHNSMSQLDMVAFLK